LLKVTIGVALLLVIALIGHRRTFTRLRLPVGARLVYLTGTEFILVGVALGDALIGLLDEGTLRSLTPLLSLGLGFVGLIFGIQLELRKILRFPARYLPMATIQAVVTLLVVSVPCYFILKEWFVDDELAILVASLILGATAACTAQTALALIGREFGLRGAPVMDLLRYISSVDAAVGLVVLAFASCLLHAQPVIGVDAGVAFQWFVVSLGIGIAMGFLLHLLTEVRCREEELPIFVVGMVTFSSGIALALDLSPLFINTMMGVTVANLTGSRNRIFNFLARLERPFYILLVVLAGSIWRPGSPWVLLLAAFYLGLRALGKLGGGRLAVRAAASGTRPPASLGLGLLSQGGMAVAMVMNYHQLSSAPVTAAVVTTVLLAVIGNELISPSMAKRVLRTAGEVTP
jgi:hypothetical protein